VIESQRLLLRPLAIEDRDALIEIFADPEVKRFMSPFGPENADERLRSYRESWAQRGYGLMAVIHRGTGELIGRSGLYYWPQFDETELGWLLRRDRWGSGYATEAGRACLEWGFREFDFPYITSMIDPSNARSIAVAERLGMKLLRDDVLLGVAVVVYVVTRDESRGSIVSWPSSPT
jgi:RimJ/RimL family protein N-acetyltransferase